MDKLIEKIVVNIIARKNLESKHPLSATLTEIKASIELDEAIKDSMRSLAKGGKYKAGLTISKVPMLILNYKDEK